jgi:1-piperideine-2-carboxylate/1-pyrroline-2-carboxylate reductase [NAD(P)H]
MHPTPLSSTEPPPGIVVCDAARTTQLLPFGPLVDAVARAAIELEEGVLASPARQVLPLGKGGVLLSMPATAPGIGVHKLVSVQPANAAQGLPAIHGTVTVMDGETGRAQCVLDGPVVTGRRTAAVTLLALRSLAGRLLDEVLLIGTGAQARHHLAALQALHPRCRVWVRGRDARATAAFCAASASPGQRVSPCPADAWPQVQAVVTLTSATAPVYDEPGQAGRVVVGVGAFKPEMAEIGPQTLSGSAIYADDPAGARHEAGDLLRAGVDWAGVRSLARLLREGADSTRPAVFKSVGCAAWDLAAARVALARGLT